MRVLHVTNAWPTARQPIKGVFVQEQVESLRRAGIDCDVLAIDTDQRRWRAYADALRALRRRQGDYDLVHCHHIYTILIGLFVVPRARLIGSFMNDGRHNIKGRLAPLGAPTFALATTLLRWQIHKARLPSGADSAYVRCIPNGVDTDHFAIVDRGEARRALGLDPEADYALCVSANSLRPEKRYDLFNAALERLAAQGTVLQPLVLSAEPRERVPLYFAAARIHLLVSDFEGSPNSVREALACGTPVVARDVGGVRHIIDGIDGCAATGDDPGAIADAAMIVLARRDTEDERVALRQAVIDRGFTLDGVARRIAALYEEVNGAVGRE